MNKLTQNAKELLAIQILKEFGCFEEAKVIAKANKTDLKGMPEDSIKYLTIRLAFALEAIDRVELSEIFEE